MVSALRRVSGQVTWSCADILYALMSTTYDARNLLVLEGLEAVRKRPGMYIGSTDTRGLMHCLWEIIDNSVDEALGGHCSKIEVVLHDDSPSKSRQRTWHPGRHRKEDRTVRRRGGVHQAARRRQVRRRLLCATGGLHGVGASVVNALSERLEVEVIRDGAMWAHVVQRGEAEWPAGESRVGCQERRAGHPRPLLGRPADLHQEREVQLRRACQPRPADVLPRARLELVLHRRAAIESDERAPLSETSSTTAASPSSAISSPRTKPSPMCSGCRVDDSSPRPSRLLDDKGHMTPQEVEPDLGGRHRAAVGDRLRHRDSLLRQHHRDAQGRHPCPGLRARPDQDVQRGAAGGPAAQAGRRRTSSRTTSSRG